MLSAQPHGPVVGVVSLHLAEGAHEAVAGGDVLVVACGGCHDNNSDELLINIIKESDGGGHDIQFGGGGLVHQLKPNAVFTETSEVSVLGLMEEDDLANITEHGLLGVSEAIDAGGNAPDTHYDPWVVHLNK